ncbi:MULTISPECIES: UDP-N-acetylmuramate dehydrogenase [Pseudonocardia]|uniref:UDP-N-acetylenolpyruvoylglucosamine reductase n=2 Tax=Pseudonocardia TaxID=1847 RepID=A0A1Y2MS94_PSEAH|nr:MULTISPECIES: UDP-N-acetylmuramate dehydrogenase [Pseudonocardia]OSY38096.1 UDP-N-acetylenolpyruvoylglucosamine reductase [Pseudonocardia autotrophica]TDN75537.1 UDP-N-acetylmuramate dehydrogenase [Pseudonocardia autotrophica]BBF99507.1 UDP-N-acetylenolpyruvoylglucosamine reductase [Pseudonocardia autotrophica]GEC28508.1 UDP-N-acetylenolpyruvoylglucosamine reductase [Pseudonocardia saturnea]
MSSPASTTTDPRLSAHTTLRLGGPAARIVRAEGAAEVVDAVRSADAAGERVLLVGGGSNLVVADAGFDGTAVLLAGRGLSHERRDGTVVLTAEAGEDWDDVVAATVAEGLGGLECLSGIPGRTGATPVQNVGAYGVEIADLLVDVDLYDRRTRTVREHVPAAALGLAYRTSVLKGNDDAIVLRARFALRADGRSAPIRYAELARTLGVEQDSRVDPAVAREAVLALRRGKGMVLDASDHDTWSAGSFFTNPVLAVADAPVVDGLAAWPAGEGRVKLSAAGLIQQAGFGRGHTGPGGRVSLSTRHVLALTHRGGGTTADLLALAREVRDGVADRFRVDLHPEPVLVGCALRPAR